MWSAALARAEYLRPEFGRYRTQNQTTRVLDDDGIFRLPSLYLLLPTSLPRPLFLKPCLPSSTSPLIPTPSRSSRLS
jgi:hypothetical protein